MSRSSVTIKHQKVFETLKNEIISGKYRDGERFPSETELVGRFGFSRPTVMHALNDLRSEGYLERRQGAGERLLRVPEEARGLKEKSRTKLVTKKSTFILSYN